MKCETCAGVHDGTFASGRFCSRSCSRKFNRAEVNEKIFLSLRKKGATCKRCKTKFVRERGANYYCPQCPPVKRKDHSNFDELPNNEMRKSFIYNEQGGRFCSWCKNTTWNEKPIPLELDHIDGNRKDNSRTNCRVLCPNCHAQTPTWKWRNKKLRGPFAPLEDST